MRKGAVLIGTAALLLAAGSAASAADGDAIFKAQCAKCHGETGKADTTIAKAMKIPALAGDANVQKMAEADIVAKIKANAKHPGPIKGMSEEDLNAVAAHVKKLAGP
jgi:mono/diheme cytochrome c family protein